MIVLSFSSIFSMYCMILLLLIFVLLQVYHIGALKYISAVGFKRINNQENKALRVERVSIITIYLEVKNDKERTHGSTQSHQLDP